jgi:hypothetical protein
MWNENSDSNGVSILPSILPANNESWIDWSSIFSCSSSADTNQRYHIGETGCVRPLPWSVVLHCVL